MFALSACISARMTEFAFNIFDIFVCDRMCGIFVVFNLFIMGIWLRVYQYFTRKGEGSMNFLNKIVCCKHKI